MPVLQAVPWAQQYLLVWHYTGDFTRCQLNADARESGNAAMHLAKEAQPWLAAASKLQCRMPSFAQFGSSLLQPSVQAALQEWAASCPSLGPRPGVLRRLSFVDVQQAQASKNSSMPCTRQPHACAELVCKSKACVLAVPPL